VVPLRRRERELPEKRIYVGSLAKTIGNGIAIRSPMINVAKITAIIQP
jgi:hypothetical protein